MDYSTSETAAPAQQHTASRSLLNWVRNHDESALFVVAYISLAVVLTLWISLFWLIVVVGIHALFEVIRQAERFDRTSQVLLEALWEVKLDIALVLFALALALYMEVILGLIGLQSAVRAGAATAARTGSRFLALENTIRGIALTLDDLFNIGRFIRPLMRVFRREETPRPVDAAAVEPASRPDHTGWRGKWGMGDHVAIGLNIACALLIVVSPALTEHTPRSAAVSLMMELHPYPAALAADDISHGRIEP